MVIRVEYNKVGKFILCFQLKIVLYSAIIERAIVLIIVALFLN